MFQTYRVFTRIATSSVIEGKPKTSNVISLVGISDPKLGIPFISIEALIDGSGEEILRNIIKGKDIRISNKSEKQIVLKNLCKQSLIEFITFLNPEKIYSLLEEFVNSIEKSTRTIFSVYLGFCLHVEQPYLTITRTSQTLSSKFKIEFQFVLN